MSETKKDPGLVVAIVGLLVALGSIAFAITKDGPSNDRLSGLIENHMKHNDYRGPKGDQGAKGDTGGKGDLGNAGPPGGQGPPGASVPVGTIVAWYGAKEDLAAHPNWLACDGTGFSNEDYPDLAARLGKLQTPDLRGMFLRGLKEGVSEPLGEPQDDATRESPVLRYSGTKDENTYRGHVISHGPGSNPVFEHWWYPSGAGDYPGNKTREAAPETRPKNVAVLWIIKAR